MRTTKGLGLKKGLGLRVQGFAGVALAIAFIAVVASAPSTEPLWDTGTFSILGYDPQTGEVGGAVQSRVFSVGNGVLWADADAGVAATQAIVDVGYGPKAIDLLRKGMQPEAIIPAAVWLAQQTATSFTGQVVERADFGVTWGPEAAATV